VKLFYTFASGATSPQDANARVTFFGGNAPQEGSDPADLNATSLRLNADAAHLSSDGDLVVVAGATHVSLTGVDAHAAQVAEAIRRVVEKTRTRNRDAGPPP
jgi:hypothetical protein